jgi:hypothetical protein
MSPEEAARELANWLASGDMEACPDCGSVWPGHSCMPGEVAR